MTRCNTLNVSSCNSQLNKLKAGIKNGTKVTLNPSSNVTGDSKDENNFSHELLSTHAQISNILKDFWNGSSSNTKSPKTRWYSQDDTVRTGGILTPTHLLAAIPQVMFQTGVAALEREV